MSIEIRDVTKKWKKTVALKNVSLEFGENRIYGLLGRNGAGKSTMLNIIANRVFATEGTVLIDGENAVENDKVQSKVYLMSEQTLYSGNMTVKSAFKTTKDFYKDFDVSKANEMAEKFVLDTKKRISTLSTGYKTIFKLCIALSQNTPYVFLDEPILGLDANHRDLFYKLLLESYNENPKTIILSTHLIEEIENIIEYVVVIKNGEVIINEETERLLLNSYTVTGADSEIEKYITDKKVISTGVVGSEKTAYILGKYGDENISGNLQKSHIDLQELFVQLTN
ncbi:MAG: ABC transporter ATP-binding protein [Oscillospiraceae bacterium]